MIKARVLLVSPDVDLSTRLIEHLTPQGYEISRAVDEDHADNILKTHPPDVLLVTSPGINLMRIRSITPPQVPVIYILHEYMDTSRLDLPLPYPADDYLFHIDDQFLKELSARIPNALKRSQRPIKSDDNRGKIIIALEDMQLASQLRDYLISRNYDVWIVSMDDDVREFAATKNILWYPNSVVVDAGLSWEKLMRITLGLHYRFQHRVPMVGVNPTKWRDNPILASPDPPIDDYFSANAELSEFEERIHTLMIRVHRGFAMSPSFEEIYAHHAAEYDALISREDYQGNLLKTLEAIRPLAGLDVVEMGAGTGRFTRMLAPHVKSIRAYDAAQHMLDKAAETLRAMGVSNWTVQAADNRAIPAEDDSADLSIAGWSFGHSVAWYPDTWRDEIGKAISEMTRVLRPNGTAVIVETLGTGTETPLPPTPGLSAYYKWLEKEHGFKRSAIRTDYKFESLEEAESLTRFFFGNAMGDAVVRHQWVILPECTGIWTKTL